MSSRDCDTIIGPCGCGAWHDAPASASATIVEGKKKVNNTEFLEGAVAMATLRKQDPLAAYVLELVRRVIALEHAQNKRGPVNRSEFTALAKEVRRIASITSAFERCR